MNNASKCNKLLFFLQGSDDFLGRVTITPTVKIQPTQGKKAELDWHPVTSFGESAGEILCAFELLLADPGVDLPFEPTRSDTDKKNFIVPQGIAPVQQRTAIEVRFYFNFYLWFDSFGKN